MNNDRRRQPAAAALLALCCVSCEPPPKNALEQSVVVVRGTSPSMRLPTTGGRYAEHPLPMIEPKPDMAEEDPPMLLAVESAARNADPYHLAQVDPAELEQALAAPRFLVHP